MLSSFGRKSAQCEEFTIRGAYPELAKSVPLNPKYDADHQMSNHQWGVEKLPSSQLWGQRTHGEVGRRSLWEESDLPLDKHKTWCCIAVEFVKCSVCSCLLRSVDEHWWKEI